MTKHRNAVVLGAVVLSFAMAPAAWAGHPGPHYTGHEQTATVSCTGGTGYVVDANALFGQQTETAAWNAGDHGTTCGVTLDP
jgi:hypothetical protein